MSVPNFKELMNPTMHALKKLGGSGSIIEIDDAVINVLELPEEDVNQPHGETGQTELKYRLRWARTYLKGYGVLSNTTRGVWALTPEGEKASAVNPDDVVKFYAQKSKGFSDDSVAPSSDEDDDFPDVDVDDDENLWRDELREILLAMTPAAFERLCQRLLRESGFIEVKVTGKSGDGGIDGEGIIRLAGFTSFRVVFQCKRHRGSIGPDVVRGLRGSMGIQADKGLLIATGTFTQGARQESSKPGFPLIDLIDGDLLADKLKELGLGVSTKTIEKVEVDSDWFNDI